MSSSTASASSFSDVMGVRRSCETAAIVKLGGAGQLGQLVLRTGPRAVADRDERRPQAVDVVHHAGGEQRGRAYGHEPGERHQDDPEDRVVARHEHQRGAGRDRDDELADRHGDAERELAPQRAEPAPARDEQVGAEHAGAAEGAQEHQRDRAVACAVGERDHAGQRDRGAEDEQRGPARAHGWNR